MADHVFTPPARPKPNKYCQQCLWEFFVAASFNEDHGGFIGEEPDEDELDAVCRETHPWRFDD